MKVAYIDNQLNNREYIYYSSFFCALQTQEIELKSFDNPSFNLDNFDVVIFGLGFFSVENPNHYLRDIISRNKRIKKIAILHKIKNYYDQKLSFCKINNIDLILTTTPFSERIQKDSQIKSRILPYCANSKIFRDFKIEKKYDIGFSGALHAGKKNGCEDDLENIRVNIKKELDKTDLRIFWNGTDRVETRIKSIDNYVAKINECKLWLCVTGPSYDVSPRYHEVPLCGTLVFSNKIPKSEYDHIFKHMHNCISFKNDLSDFHSELHRAISYYNIYQKNGWLDACENSSYEGRGKQLMRYINEM